MTDYSHIILKKSGLKATPGRLALLDTFADQHKPLNADQLAECTKDIDLATIYRTIITFEKKGIIKRIDLRKGSLYYELAVDHHHHIVCRDCGFIEDISECVLDRVAQKLSQKSKKFTRIDDHALEFFGVCMSCAKS